MEKAHCRIIKRRFVFFLDKSAECIAHRIGQKQYGNYRKQCISRENTLCQNTCHTIYFFFPNQFDAGAVISTTTSGMILATHPTKVAAPALNNSINPFATAAISSIFVPPVYFH